MKIMRLDIKNFKGLARLTLETEGKNVLLLGENGSGKTSLVRALQCFLDSSFEEKEVSFERNLYCDDTEDAFVDVTLSGETSFHFDVLGNTALNQKLVQEAAISKRFLEYKHLLKTYFLPSISDLEEINIFDLLVTDLLSETINEKSEKTIKQTFKAHWKDLQDLIPTRNSSKNVANLKAEAEKFNEGLAGVIKLIHVDASRFLGAFYSDLSFELEAVPVVYDPPNKSFPNPTVRLLVTFKGKLLTYHQNVLNEARLSSIAICLYIAAALKAQPSELKILVLDDVLIGLDANNRLPVIDIFSMPELMEHQIFLLTYDPVWFNLVRSRVNRTSWKAIQFSTDLTTGVAIFRDSDLLTRAEEYCKQADYKAAAVYTRSALEEILQHYCEKRKIPIPFTRVAHLVKLHDFIEVIFESPASGKYFLIEKVIDKIQNLLRSIERFIQKTDSKFKEFEEIRNQIKNVLDEISGFFPIEQDIARISDLVVLEIRELIKKLKKVKEEDTSSVLEMFSEISERFIQIRQTFDSIYSVVRPTHTPYLLENQVLHPLFYELRLQKHDHLFPLYQTLL